MNVSVADFVHTDVWVSMGESKDDWEVQAKLLRPYQVNAAAMKRTGKMTAKFMHHRPAVHDVNKARSHRRPNDLAGNGTSQDSLHA